jgi:hypothetical protein
MLLDTCLVQHLEHVAAFGDDWNSSGVDEVFQQFPTPLGTEIVALGDLLYMYSSRGDSPGWAVGRVSRIELEASRRSRLGAAYRWWWEMAYFWDAMAAEWPEWSHLRRLGWEPAPAVSEHQLSFDLQDRRGSQLGAIPSFGPFRDIGDRAMIIEAIRHGFPAILTTDLRSFWRHRRWLYPFRVEVWRPTDLMRAHGYEPLPAPSSS